MRVFTDRKRKPKIFKLYGAGQDLLSDPFAGMKQGGKSLANCFAIIENSLPAWAETSMEIIKTFISDVFLNRG